MHATVLACLKWAPRRVDVDPLTGLAAADRHDHGLAAADAAALEVALVLGEAWGTDVVAACVGPVDADAMLTEARAAGVARAVRVDLPMGTRSDVVAAELAHLARDCALVVCGDASADRGSGTVPALVAAHLDRAQALGALSVVPDQPGVAVVERRLDRGARERLRLRAPAVLSVEATTARLRRAGLPGVLAARAVPVEVLVARPAHAVAHTQIGETRPHRPRPRPVPAPDPSAPALTRQLQLTAAAEERTPPRTVHLDPAPAAAAIVDQLREWGYV